MKHSTPTRWHLGAAFLAAICLLSGLVPSLPRVLAFTAPGGQSTPLSISQPGWPEASLNMLYTQSVSIAGGLAPYQITPQGSLPNGMAWQTSARAIVLTGTPTQTGVFDLTLNVVDALGEHITQSISLKVSARFRPENSPTVAIPVTETLTTTDTPKVQLPVVITDLETISTADAPAIQLPVVIIDKETLTTTDTPSVSFPTLTINPSTIPSAALNSSYPSQFFSASGGSGAGYNLTWTGAIPPGMLLAYPGGGTGPTLTLSGTPTSAGSYAFVVNATDSTGDTGTQSYTLFVSPASAGCERICPGTPQTITTGLVPYPTYGQASFSLSATATSGLPVTYTVLSGPATATGPYGPFTIGAAGSVTITATQAGGLSHGTTYAPAFPQYIIVTILKAPLYVTPYPTGKSFDAQYFGSFYFTVSGFVNGDTYSSTCFGGTSFCGFPSYFSIDYLGTSNPIPGDAPAGSYDIVPNVTSMTATNYTFDPCEQAPTPCSGLFTVYGGASQAIIFPPLPPMKAGQAIPLHLTAYTTSGLPVSYSITGPGNLINGYYVHATAAGIITVTANQAGNSNYNPATPVSQTITVNP